MSNISKLFNSSLIKNMYISLTPKVFNTFVPNYRNIATVCSIFNDSVPASERVLLEERVLEAMSGSQGDSTSGMAPVDNLVYKTFVSKFNEEYSENLLEEQKELLTKYITSFSDNGLEIKTYLNEEIQRITGRLQEISEDPSISQDEDLSTKAKEITSMLEGFSDRKISTEVIETVLKTQQLVCELENLDNDSN